MKVVRNFDAERKPRLSIPMLAMTVTAFACLAGGLATASAQTYDAATTGVDPGGGIGRDVMTAVAADLGMTVAFQTMTNAEFVPALLAGTIDIIAQPTVSTAERIAQGLAFTQPYALGGDGLMVLAADMTAYGALADLAGTNVGAVAGTVYETLLRNSGVAFGSIQTFDTQANLAAAVTSGAIKAAVSSGITLGYAAQQGQLAGLRVVDTWVPTLTTAFAIAVRQTDAALLAQIDGALGRLIANGTIAGIYDDYGIAWLEP